MKILFVSAHPDPASLTHSLRNVAVEQLKADGHEVRISDLYEMNWKAAVDRADFPTLPTDGQMRPPVASMQAAATNAFTQDVLDEQEKVLWADALILSFPLWWFSVPAILKGYIDRVWTSGFGYQNGGERYGAGRLQGKRAMLMVSIGGRETHYSPSGVNGDINDVLWPINHGMLYYPGYDVLPQYVVYRTDRMDEERFKQVSEEVRERMKTLFTIAPIPFRPQGGGDYVHPQVELREEIAAQAPAGYARHLTKL